MKEVKMTDNQKAEGRDQLAEVDERQDPRVLAKEAISRARGALRTSYAGCFSGRGAKTCASLHDLDKHLEAVEDSLICDLNQDEAGDQGDQDEVCDPCEELASMLEIDDSPAAPAPVTKKGKAETK